MIIKDGTGAGYTAQVDGEGRLHVLAISETEGEFLSERGDTYNVNSGTITLTTANASGVLFIKNLGSTSIHINTVGYLIGNSTGGTGDLLAEIIANPTTGTLISGATDVDINVNKNFGSTKSLNVQAYKGAEGNTVTNGTVAYTSLLPGAARSYVINTGTIILPTGASLAIRLTPQTSNTNMDVQVFLAVNNYTLEV